MPDAGVPDQEIRSAGRKEKRVAMKRSAGPPAMSPEAFAALLRIRDSGVTNMLDVNTVQRIAFDAGEYDLVMYIEEHKREYVNFIIYGR